MFTLKTGLGIGGAICGAIVDSFGFIPNVVQTESTLFRNRISSSIATAYFCCRSFQGSFYPISKHLNEKIQQELDFEI